MIMSSENTKISLSRPFSKMSSSMIKHLSFLAILLLNLVAANALAQKNELRLDLRYWPIDDYETRAGASLSYFQA